MSPNEESTTVRPIDDQDQNSTTTWIPDLGGTELSIFHKKQERPNGRVAPEEMARVLSKSSGILSRCIDPSGRSPQQTTSLVVGKVQSGKTLSFTSLIALAHDNGFGLVVLLAGTKNILSTQSLARLESSLGDTSDTKATNWIFAVNPSSKTSSGTQFKNSLERWKRNKADPNARRVCVAVLLKEKTNLPNFADLLNQMNLTDVPTLIIDDEADQASLNTRAQQNLKKKTTLTSKIYREILSVRSKLPRHSYVQYTATPQSTLLLAIADTLNPDTVFLLKPGSGYTGGETFFRENSPYLEIIPASDLLSQRGPASTAAPESLVKAFAAFIYGSALELFRTHNKEVRSMMIHPSHENFYHREYERHATTLRDEWMMGLSNVNVRTVIHQSLEDGRRIIQKTFSTEILPSVAQLEPQITKVLENLEVREVNFTPAGREEIKWNTSPFWCVVGGANLDRGFTVEGLTVTYMPRPLGGSGNADTMQQRARFFGYKGGYLQYCRVFLESGLKQAFDDYVTHENSLHTQLEKIEGKSLNEWRRIFVLDRAMQLTRKNVIGIETEQVVFEGWRSARHLHDADVVGRQMNVSLWHNFTSNLGISPVDPAIAYPTAFIDQRRGNRHELYEDIPLQTFLDKFIQGWSLQGADVADEIFIASLKYLLESLQAALSNRPDVRPKNLMVDLFVMRGGAEAERSLNGDNSINPFQGRSPANTADRSKLKYGGDMDFFFPDSLSVQLHFFAIKGRSDNAGPIPWLCYRLPEDFKDGVIHVDKSRS